MTRASSDTVVVYTTRISPKFAGLTARWRERQFAPSLVVIETGRASLARRLWSAVRRRPDDSARICRQQGWRYVRVASVNAEAAIAAVEGLKPLVAVAAGAGILRKRILAAPRLGTLNAHMGLLPAHRGVNACEWAALSHEPIGCSVFWVDEGIDTGPILATRQVDAGDCRSIAELRGRVDACQLDLLDEVLAGIVDERRSPPAQPQHPEEGRQFFRMHDDLRRVLEDSLSGRTGD